MIHNFKKYLTVFVFCILPCQSVYSSPCGQAFSTNTGVISTAAKILRNKDLTLKMRISAANILAKTALRKSKVSFKTLIGVLENYSYHPDLRSAIIVALQKNHPEIISDLLDILKYRDDTEAKAYAAIVLGEMRPRDPEVIDTLLGTLVSPLTVSYNSRRPEKMRVYSAREEAATALGKIGLKGNNITTVLNMLQKPNWQIQGATAFGLGIIKPKDPAVLSALTPPLIVLARDRDWRIHEHAIFALGELGLKSNAIIHTLVSLLRNSSTSEKARIKVVKALGKIQSSDPLVIDTLIDMAKEDLYELIATALKALGDIASDDPRVINILLDTVTTKNNNQIIYKAAIEALGKIKSDDPRIIDTLIGLLTDPQEGYQYKIVAAMAVWRIQPDNPLIKDTLANLLNSPYRQQRRAVAAALKQIRDTDLERHKKKQMIEPKYPIWSHSQILLI